MAPRLQSGITRTALSFGALPFFHILVSLWMVSGDSGGSGGKRVGGDELTGYYWLCGGLVHKSPLSPTGQHGQNPSK